MRPSSRNIITAVARKVFEIEPICNRCSSRMGVA